MHKDDAAAGLARLDPWLDLLGIELPPERLAENLRLYADILAAIRKLRELDLTEVHPAVVFDPAGRGTP